MARPITADQYVSHPELLEAYYTPYQEKCAIVDTIIDQIVDATGTIDYTRLKGIKNSIFLATITNIDMMDMSDNMLPYDILVSNRVWEQLIASIQDEYDAFDEILELKLQTIREQHSPYMILKEIRDNLMAITNYEE